jgi:uridine phosphorylase
MDQISDADLIINRDGSIYHLNLLPEDLANTIITVGDPDRVAEISKHFDRIELKKGKREFITHTGYVGTKRITVISTGIGTDNIDIVLNEVDALVNVDFGTRKVKDTLTSLDIIRIGTSGAIQLDLPIGTILASSHGLGMDSLMNFYATNASTADQLLLDKIKAHLHGFENINPYLHAGSKKLLNKFAKELPQGITVTAPGFYAPQGRKVRAALSHPDIIGQLNTFEFDSQRITNLEMETAGIYALAHLLGHEAISINAILASRVQKVFSKNPQVLVNKAIEYILDRI